MTVLFMLGTSVRSPEAIQGFFFFFGGWRGNMVVFRVNFTTVQEQEQLRLTTEIMYCMLSLGFGLKCS